MTKRLELTVRGGGGGWAVYNGLEQVSRAFSCEYTAHGTAQRMEIEARSKVRDCLCCGARFVSTGPGHRMCEKCRRDPMRLLP